MNSEVVAVELEPARESSLDLFGLRLFAVLLISGGMASVEQMVGGLFNDSFVLDFGFLGIFIGRGLLMRMEFWRAWAVFVAWCGIIFAPLVAVVSAFGGTEPMLVLGLEPAGSAIDFAVYFYAAAVFLFSLWMRKLFGSEVVRRTFSEKGEVSDGWWLVFLTFTALTSGAFLVVMSVHQRVVDRTFDQLEYHEAIVEVVDPSKGVLDPTVSTMGSWTQRERKLPKTDYTFRRDEFGVLRVHVGWLSTGPIEVTFSSEGYVAKDVRLDGKDHGKKIRVELAREKKVGKAQLDPSGAPDKNEQVLDSGP